MKYQVNIEGYCYRVQETGSGFPLVWLHGMFHSPEIEDLFAVVDFTMLAASFRIIRIELPAHGNSPLATHSERLRWSSIATNIRSICNKLDISKFAIGGFSQGAGISAHVAVLYPESVTCLILAMLPRIWILRPAVKKTYSKLLKLLNDENCRHLMSRLFVLTKYPPLHLGWNEETAENINNLMMKISNEAFVQILQGAVKSDFPEPDLFRNLNKPVFIMGWENDPNHPTESFEMVAKQSGKSTLYIMKENIAIIDASQTIKAYILINM